MNLYRIDKEYLSYLQNFDKNVKEEHEGRNPRPYVGIVIKFSKFNYFIPLTSPKEKHIKMHNMLDFLKIANGAYGAINFNNMIPVLPAYINEIDTTIYENDSITDKNYKNILLNQLDWCNTTDNQEKITAKANKLYCLYKDNKLYDSIKERCANFPLLEEKCREYEKMLETQKSKQAEEEITI